MFAFWSIISAEILHAIHLSRSPSASLADWVSNVHRLYESPSFDLKERTGLNWHCLGELHPWQEEEIICAHLESHIDYESEGSQQSKSGVGLGFHRQTVWRARQDARLYQKLNICPERWPWSHVWHWGYPSIVEWVEAACPRWSDLVWIQIDQRWGCWRKGKISYQLWWWIPWPCWWLEVSW